MNKFSIFIILLALAFSSCQHYYYIAPAKNVPLFKEKNEYRATVAIGGGDEASTTDLQAAYSITNNFAVMANYMSANGGNKSGDEWGSGKYFDAAVGYFKCLSNDFVFGIYGGIGSSNQHHRYSSNTSTADLSFSKLFIQPTIGLTYNRFDYAFTPAFGMVSFNKINNQINFTNSEYDAVNLIALNRNSLLFEPTFTIRAGWKYVKLQLQSTGTMNLTHSNLAFEDSKVSIGLTFAFAERFKRKAIPKTKK